MILLKFFHIFVMKITSVCAKQNDLAHCALTQSSKFLQSEISLVGFEFVSSFFSDDDCSSREC